jgi:hypothetical protein
MIEATGKSDAEGAMRAMRCCVLVAVTSLAVAAPAYAAPAKALRVIGQPAVSKKRVRVAVIRSVGPASLGCARLRTGTLAVPRSSLRSPLRLRPGDRLRARAVSRRGLLVAPRLRVTRRSKAPSFARLRKLVTDTRRAGRSAAAELAAIAKIPPDAAGGRNFKSADQARALATRLNLLDERLLKLAGALDRSTAAIDGAFGRDGRRCRGLRRARDRRTRSLRAAAAGARRASRAIEAGTGDIDRLLSFLPPEGGSIPIGTVGEVGPAVSGLLKLLDGILGGGR